MLTLFEQLFLVAIHETKGTYIGSTIDRLKPGLIGAVLMELAVLGKIQVTENHRIQLLNHDPTKDEILDDVVESLKEADKGRKISFWINTLSAKTDKYRRQIIKKLVRKGVVTQEDDHLLWVIPSPLQPESRSSAKYVINKRMREIVLAQVDVEQRDMVLLCLVRACGLLDLVYLADESKFASRTISKMLFSLAIKDPIIQTVQEIEAALVSVVDDD